VAEADPRFKRAVSRIDGRPHLKKLYEDLQESLGYSKVEAAVFVLGREYPQ